MIYTLTINPAIDMNVTTTDLVFGKVNRTKDAVYSENGKGINVSKVLKHFGIESGIIGFFGGFSGDFIVDTCRKNGYKVCDIKTDGITRINVFVNVNGRECKLVNNGPLINPAKQEELLDLLQNLNDMDILVVSGSLAAGIDDSYYDRILSLCKEKNAKVILDISAHKLKDLLSYQPMLIKPNDEEIKEIFGYDISDEKSAVYALRQLNEMGARNILMTMGERGSYFYNGCDIYFCEAHPIRLKSSACAGDACLGAFLSIWLANPENIESAMKLASATGANVAESDGLGNFLKVAEYEKTINMRKII